MARWVYSEECASAAANWLLRRRECAASLAASPSPSSRLPRMLSTRSRDSSRPLPLLLFAFCAGSGLVLEGGADVESVLLSLAARTLAD